MILGLLSDLMQYGNFVKEVTECCMKGEKQEGVHKSKLMSAPLAPPPVMQLIFLLKFQTKFNYFKFTTKIQG